MLATAIDFGSMIIIPFIGLLGILRALKVRVSGYLAGLLIVWLFLGIILMGGGITPMGPGDIVWPEDRKAWLGSEFVGVVKRLWLFGLGFGLPLLLISWLQENRAISRVLKVINGVIAVGAFLFASWRFMQLYLKF